MIRIKRVYDLTTREDGRRFLVDRFWPRGMKKEAAHIEAWLRDVAPSKELCSWFGHDPARWDEFCERYFAELDGNPEAWRLLLEKSQQGKVTILYGARDMEHNNAVALRLYLEQRLESRGKNGAG